MKLLESISRFAGNTFVIWVLLFTFLALVLPGRFLWIVPHISVLLGITMFGMGMTLSTDDLKQAFIQPKQVAIGVVAQYTFMPLLAYVLATGLRLPPEIASGVILVGCCPGGTASNVMTYLARGNVALSVAMTSVTTLLAPIITPVLTLLLASKWLPVSAGDMFLSVVKIVLIPIILGVAVQSLFGKRIARTIHVLPLVSVVAIVSIVAAVVNANQQKILESGLFILLIVALHNGLGYLLGYGIARLLKLDYADMKAISIEVGMQNSGLGAALATAHFTPFAAVPSAIFSAWHNISGALLATWWRKNLSD